MPAFIEDLAKRKKIILADSSSSPTTAATAIMVATKKPSSAELKGYKRVKREMGWNRLTLMDWQSHPDLRDVKKLEDIPPEVLLRLDNDFGSAKSILGECQSDHLRYLKARSRFMSERAMDYEKRADVLVKHLKDGTVHSLLLSSHKDETQELEEFNWKYASPPESDNKDKDGDDDKKTKTFISPAQLRRVVIQVVLVNMLLRLHATRDRDRAGNFEAEVDAVVKQAVGQKGKKSGMEMNSDDEVKMESQMNEDLALLREKFNRQRRTMRRMPDLAESVLKMNGMADDTTIKSLLRWYNQYLKHGGFFEDRRGHWERESIIGLFPMLQSSLKSFVRESKLVTVELARRFLSEKINEYLEEENETSLSIRQELKSRGIDTNRGISISTAHAWMKKAGCKYAEARQCYYTDNHNRADVIAYRDKYWQERQQLALRQPLWIKHNKHSSHHKEGDGIMISVEQIHVDRLGDEVYDKVRSECGRLGGQLHQDFKLHATKAKEECMYQHDPERCKCDRIIYHMGQDESIYKSSSYPKKEWQVDGQRRKHKKGDGTGVMVSAFVDEERGFGFPLTDEEIEIINSHPSRTDKRRIERRDQTPTGSPGLVFFNHGSGPGRDGYWNCTSLLAQLEELIDCFDIVEPNRQLLLELDWSSGHTKMDENSLTASKMNASWGGKQPVMRSTTVTADCLGEGALLKPGDLQSLIFVQGDAPPHFDPTAQPYEHVEKRPPKKPRKKRNQRKDHPDDDDGGTVNIEEIAKEKDDQHESAQLRRVVVDSDGLVETTIPGYVGKPKGLKQILFERGLYKPKMTVDDMRKTLGACPDFAQEMSLLKAAVHRRGHILILSPKCHPEVAGVGIEYCWGKSKMSFRRRLNDYLPKNLHRNVLASFGDEHLPLARVRRYARKTRDYLRVYEQMRIAKEQQVATKLSSPDNNCSVEATSTSSTDRETVRGMTEQEALMSVIAKAKKISATRDGAAAAVPLEKEPLERGRRTIQDEDMWLGSMSFDGFRAIENMLKTHKSHRNVMDIDLTGIGE